MDETYRGDQTPFLSRHRCGRSPYTLSAKTFHKAYVPFKNVKIGELAVAFCGSTSIMGEVTTIKRKGRRKYITFGDKPNKSYMITKCVALPVINEFVRHRQTKKWFKVTAVGANGTLTLVPVLKMPAPGTPTQGTPQKTTSDSDTSAAYADKSDESFVESYKGAVAADESTTPAAAADKSAVDKSAAAADKSAVDKSAPAADESAVDKSAAAADESATPAAAAADESAVDKSAAAKSYDRPVESAMAMQVAGGEYIAAAYAQSGGTGRVFGDRDQVFEY